MKECIKFGPKHSVQEMNAVASALKSTGIASSVSLSERKVKFYFGDYQQVARIMMREFGGFDYELS